MLNRASNPPYRNRGAQPQSELRTRFYSKHRGSSYANVRRSVRQNTCPRTHFFGKPVPSATVGELVEAVAYVHRQTDYNEPASDVVKECVVVDQLLYWGNFSRTWRRRVPLQKLKLVVFPSVVYKTLGQRHH